MEGALVGLLAAGLVASAAGSTDVIIEVVPDLDSGVHTQLEGGYWMAAANAFVTPPGVSPWCACELGAWVKIHTYTAPSSWFPEAAHPFSLEVWDEHTKDWNGCGDSYSLVAPDWREVLARTDAQDIESESFEFHSFPVIETLPLEPDRRYFFVARLRSTAGVPGTFYGTQVAARLAPPPVHSARTTDAGSWWDDLNDWWDRPRVTQVPPLPDDSCSSHLREHGHRIVLRPAQAGSCATVCGPTIEVTDVAFDFEPGLNDGQDIRINLHEDVCVINPAVTDDCPDDRGEWVKDVRNHPAALVSSALQPLPKLRIKARLRSHGSASQAIVWAESPLLGTTSEVEVSFDENGLSPWSTFQGTVDRPAEVQFHDESIQWWIRDIDESGSAPQLMDTSGPHRLYFVLAPGHPANGAPFEVMHEPWAEVLARATAWSAGDKSFQEVASSVTIMVHEGLGLGYHVTGDPQYYVPNNPPRFYLNDFLTTTSSLSATPTWVNCFDTAMAVAVFGSALGAPMRFHFMTEMSPPGPRRAMGAKPYVTNMVALIGDSHLGHKSTWRTNNPFWWQNEPLWPQFGEPGDNFRWGGFGAHSFAILRLPSGQWLAYDALQQIDTDARPDEQPMKFELVLGRTLSTGGGMYVGLRDFNDQPPSDPMQLFLPDQINATFHVNAAP